MARAAVPKLFERNPKPEFGEHLVTKFVFIISNLLFSRTYTTDRHRQAAVTLNIHNSSLDRLGESFF